MAEGQGEVSTLGAQACALRTQREIWEEVRTFR